MVFSGKPASGRAPVLNQAVSFLSSFAGVVRSAGHSFYLGGTLTGALPSRSLRVFGASVVRRAAAVTSKSTGRLHRPLLQRYMPASSLNL